MPTPPRLLLTRPREDSLALAAALAEAGVAAMIEPLLTIVPTPAPLALDGVQAILATSANGVRAFAGASARRDLPLLAVGDATRGTALAAGFADVASAEGDVDSLAALARERLSAGAGALLHVAGSEVAGDLEGRLTRAGFSYRRAVLYKAKAAEALTSEAVEALRKGYLDGAVFFSPRTAATFVSVIAKSHLSPAPTGLVAFCLSAAVAARLHGLAWRQVRTARSPDQDSLLACILETFGRRGGHGSS